MIDVDGYTPNPTNTECKRRIAVHHQGSNKNASQHAERSVFGSLPASVSAYLLVQNAFPCSLCHAWFTQQSAAYDIIIKITSDEGKYSLDHAAPGGKGPGTPHIIYYHGGMATQVGLHPGREPDLPPDSLRIPTSPICSHAAARAAISPGTRPWSR